MIVGTLRLHLVLRSCVTLKDKRRIVKSLIDRLKHRFNASVAEVGALDLHRRSELGVAIVSNDSRFVQAVLSKIVDFARWQTAGAELVDFEQEIL